MTAQHHLQIIDMLAITALQQYTLRLPLTPPYSLLSIFLPYYCDPKIVRTPCETVDLRKFREKEIRHCLCAKK